MIEHVDTFDCFGDPRIKKSIGSISI